MLSNRIKVMIKSSFFFLSILAIHSSTTKFMYPKEIDSLFIELRRLTAAVKSYYACHVILIIVESVLLFVSNVTKLTFNYTNHANTALYYNKLSLLYCILKMIFLYFVVQETHNTVEEVNIYLFFYFYFNLCLTKPP